VWQVGRLIEILLCLISSEDAPVEPRRYLKVDNVVDVVSKRAHGLQSSSQHQEATLQKALSGRVKIIDSQSKPASYA